MLSRGRARRGPGRAPAASAEQGEPFEAVLADVERVILPGITHWQSPNLFAYFPANNSGPSSSASCSRPASACRGCCGPPAPPAPSWRPTCSTGWSSCWACPRLPLGRRRRRRDPGQRVLGARSVRAARRPRAGRATAPARRTSTACCGLRLGPGPLRRSRRRPGSPGCGAISCASSPSTTTFAMRPDALADADRRRPGRRPHAVLRAAPRSAPPRRNAVDPVPALGRDLAGTTASGCTSTRRWPARRRSARSSAASTTGSSAPTATPSTRTSGCSPTSTAHCFWVADRAALLEALSILPEYLRNEADASPGAVIDYRDWQVPLGRRFRALKLWFVLRWYGAEGLAHHVRRHVALARGAGRAGSRPTTGSSSPPRPARPGLLPPRRRRRGDPGPARRRQRLRRAYLTHTRLDDRLVIRVSIGQTHTEERHVRGLWDHLMSLADDLA